MTKFSGLLLRQHRAAAGISREVLATATGRSAHSITSYELGRVTPPASVVGLLADALGCGVDDLFTSGVAS